MISEKAIAFMHKRLEGYQEVGDILEEWVSEVKSKMTPELIQKHEETLDCLEDVSTSFALNHSIAFVLTLNAQEPEASKVPVNDVIERMGGKQELRWSDVEGLEDSQEYLLSRDEVLALKFNNMATLAHELAESVGMSMPRSMSTLVKAHSVPAKEWFLSASTSLAPENTAHEEKSNKSRLH